MGRGIIESGKFRAEQLQLEQRTSDPNDPEPNEEWLRVDIKPTYEDANGTSRTGIAQYRVANSDGSVDTAPVAALGDPVGQDVIDKDRVCVDAGGSPTGTGFIPHASTGASYPNRKLEHPTAGQVAMHDALTVNAIPDSAIDDFESGDLVVENEDWSDWSKIQGDSLSAQQSVVLDGSFSGELAANSADTRWQTARSSEAQRSEFRYDFQISEQNGDSGDFHLFRLFGSGSDFVQFFPRQDGTIDFNANLNVASWSIDTHYRLNLSNIDYAAETLDVEILDVDGSTTLYSATDVAFNESVSGLDEVVVGHRNSSVGTTGSSFIDLVGWPPE